MKFKVRVTISDTMELDTEHFEADTVEGCMEEQLKLWEEGASDPGECLGLGDDYTQTIENVED